MLMMPIDTGNKAIKTEHFEFHSGISVLEDIPGEGEEAVKFKGRYYRLSPERNVYLPDKSVDERYYILTLFAIAKELRELKPPRLFLPGEVLKMDLVVGLLAILPTNLLVFLPLMLIGILCYWFLLFY